MRSCRKSLLIFTGSDAVVGLDSMQERWIDDSRCESTKEHP
jgi:hypothetical protein